MNIFPFSSCFDAAGASTAGGACACASTAGAAVSATAGSAAIGFFLIFLSKLAGNLYRFGISNSGAGAGAGGTSDSDTAIAGAGACACIGKDTDSAGDAGATATAGTTGASGTDILLRNFFWFSLDILFIFILCWTAPTGIPAL